MAHVQGNVREVWRTCRNLGPNCGNLARWIGAPARKWENCYSRGSTCFISREARHEGGDRAITPWQPLLVGAPPLRKQSWNKWRPKSQCQKRTSYPDSGFWHSPKHSSKTSSTTFHCWSPDRGIFSGSRTRHYNGNKNGVHKESWGIYFLHFSCNI
jgi:hypothetical protein